MIPIQIAKDVWIAIVYFVIMALLISVESVTQQHHFSIKAQHFAKVVQFSSTAIIQYNSAFLVLTAIVLNAICRALTILTAWNAITKQPT